MTRTRLLGQRLKRLSSSIRKLSKITPKKTGIRYHQENGHSTGAPGVCVTWASRNKLDMTHTPELGTGRTSTVSELTTPVTTTLAPVGSSPCVVTAWYSIVRFCTVTVTLPTPARQ